MQPRTCWRTAICLFERGNELPRRQLPAQRFVEAVGIRRGPQGNVFKRHAETRASPIVPSEESHANPDPPISPITKASPPTPPRNSLIPDTGLKPFRLTEWLNDTTKGAVGVKRDYARKCPNFHLWHTMSRSGSYRIVNRRGRYLRITRRGKR